MLKSSSNTSIHNQSHEGSFIQRERLSRVFGLRFLLCVLVPIAVLLLYSIYSFEWFREVLREKTYRSFSQMAGNIDSKFDEKVARMEDNGRPVQVSTCDELGKVTDTFNHMIQGLKQREELRDTLGRYVSIEIAKQLIDEGKINLGGEEIQATVLFSDIRDFTPLSEKMSAHDTVSFINEYFTYLTDPVMENNGVVNKFLGDAVLAVFTPLLGSENHADDALKAAIGMRAKLEEFNTTGVVDAKIKFGVGLNTGTLVAGNIGTSQRMEYTVIGDAVNVASRIESQTKLESTDILISHSTFMNLTSSLRGNHIFKETGPVELKGKSGRSILYTVQ